MGISVRTNLSFKVQRFSVHSSLLPGYHYIQYMHTETGG